LFLCLVLFFFVCFPSFSLFVAYTLAFFAGGLGGAGGGGGVERGV